jgi:superfamily II DNA or RNA helicase
MSDTTQPPAITKELLRELGDWRADKEGRQLAESGRVADLQFTPPILSGQVRTAGGATIAARLKLGAGQFGIENQCSCRQARVDGIICAHVVALVYAYLNPTPPAPTVGLDRRASREEESARPAVVAPFPRTTDPEPRSPTLELAVLLPVNFTQAWRSGAVQVILEASLNGGPLRPFSTIPSQPATPYVVSEADEKLLGAVERLNDGQVPAIWRLKDFDTFFSALAGHPRVMLGKKSTIVVRDSAGRPRVFLDLQFNGELQLRGEAVPTGSGETLGAWRFDGAVLECVGQAFEGKTFARSEVARFYEQKLPALEQVAEVVGNAAFEQLEFTVATPRIRATVDGTLAAVSVKLDAVYPGHVFPLTGEPRREWMPDPNNPLRYWSRNVAAERAAQQTVAAAGFAPSQRSPELSTLPTEKEAAHFLANVLPRWRDRWDVILGDRLQNFLAKCEVIAPEVAVRSVGNDWLAVDIAYKNERGETPLTPAEVRRLLEKGGSHQRLANGRIALVQTESAQEFQQVVFDCEAQQTEAGLRIPRRFGAYLTEAVRENKWQPPTALAPLQDLVLPDDLGNRLRPYQRTGVNWLQHLGANGLGGILADEMGLGKTIQALAWLAAVKDHGAPGGRALPTAPVGLDRRASRKPSLVICPTSLVTNWQAEAARFTPGLKTLLLHGPNRQARFADIASHDLVITSYALLRRDSEQYARWEFDTVILDEAQHIKNRFSQIAQATKALKAEHRFVLTGTPMENSLDDLWSIFDFLMPGYLGPAKEFKDRYETPIVRAGDAAALRRLRQRLRPFVLRRTKAEVAPELPPRIEQVAWCEMSAEQQSVYQAILEQGRREVFEHAGKGGDAKQRMAVLTTLTRLRQACCHLDLLPARDGKVWSEPSAKLELCLELIEEARSGGHRVLVFSQFVKLLRLLETALRAQELTWCYLDGATVDRQGEVRRFQESPEIPVFLISLKAGGTGLNLTGADTVIHFDPWWNPAVEEQATARAHRIGQTNIVTSYKLIAQGSVEEKIVRLQEKKKELIANTLANDEAFQQSLTWSELQGLLE